MRVDLMDEKYIKKLEDRISELEKSVCDLKRILKCSVSENDFACIDSNDQVLTITDIINLVGLPREIIYAKAMSGEIPSIKIGKRYKFSRAKVLEWFETRFDKTFEVDAFVDAYLQKNHLNG